MNTSIIRHARVELALHCLNEGAGKTVLLLHELGGSSLDWQLRNLGHDGPMYALDLSGHGQSGHLQGGGYTPEYWAGDADTALKAIDRDVVVVGAGVSAYVALLLAGARPQRVHGALLLPGAGLVGGGSEPDFGKVPEPPVSSTRGRTLQPEPTTDPAVKFSDAFLRPPWFARPFGAAARSIVLAGLDPASAPPWWRGLEGLSSVSTHRGNSVASALSTLIGEADAPAAWTSKLAE